MKYEWLKQLDELLRGERVRTELLAQGVIDVSLRRFVPIAAVLGGMYGFFMGWYALFGGRDGAVLQVFAATLKLPALFLLTLFVTFPSLYVFNALVGCRMSFQTTMRVLISAIVMNLAVAASLGPILAFFTLSTTSYAFMVLLNVAILGIAGGISVHFLLRALRVLARASQRSGEERAMEPPAAEAPLESDLGEASAVPMEANEVTTQAPGTPAPDERAKRFTAGAVRPAKPAIDTPREGAADLILAIWALIYALVGTQMGWILRPFIGSPDAAFAWFRPREGSFFQAVSGAFWRFIGG